MHSQADKEYISNSVTRALQEDIGSGDVTAALIPADHISQARVITREPIVLCGCEWFEQTLQEIDETIAIHWHYQDGDIIAKNEMLCTLQGNSRNLLSGERTALNFLQTLSGVATLSRRYADQVSDTKTQILDTRKTIPGLRLELKYAVKTGGCKNHRTGLYDGILIKENHIQAAGGIVKAIQQAQKLKTGLFIEVEVESLDELRIAIDNGAERLLLDNFSLAQLEDAVKINDNKASLEASGGITLENISAVAATGVDWISTGSLTKNIQAVDLSMLFE
ncbi:MAG: carboxylating nicotinate-nucleotide diphosphorylase [Gammaproteobacteria bacterium]|nr:carboxylating nicotinate-nucleotide diphosphorylase [Gammaproteobacteria bacterium]